MQIHKPSSYIYLPQSMYFRCSRYTPNLGYNIHNITFTIYIKYKIWNIYLCLLIYLGRYGRYGLVKVVSTSGIFWYTHVIKALVDAGPESSGQSSVATHQQLHWVAARAVICSRQF